VAARAAVDTTPALAVDVVSTGDAGGAASVAAGAATGAVFLRKKLNMGDGGLVLR
jgi:hypothetical protein